MGRGQRYIARWHKFQRSSGVGFCRREGSKGLGTSVRSLETTSSNSGFQVCTPETKSSLHFRELRGDGPVSVKSGRREKPLKSLIIRESLFIVEQEFQGTKRKGLGEKGGSYWRISRPLWE